MTDETTLKDDIHKINENFEKLLASGKVKGFRLPSSGKLNNAKLKKNYITVISIGNNRELKFSKVPIEDGTVVMDKIPKLATTDYMLTYKGKPVVILPEWSVKPFSPSENYSETVKNQMDTAGHALLLSKYESGKVEEKKKMGGNWWIFPLIIGIIVIGYLVFTQFSK